MRRFKMILLAFGLFGCAHHPLDCATGFVAWDDCEPGTRGYEIRQSALNRDDRLCQSWGAVPGTDAYVNCRASLAQANAQQRAAIAAAMINHMPAPQPAHAYQVPVNPTFNCTTQYTANQANTVCH